MKKKRVVSEMKFDKKKAAGSPDAANMFMIKEYEKMYELFNIHYNTSERVFRMYLMIVGAFLSICSYIYKDTISTIQIFNLNSLVCFTLLLVTMAGSFMFLMEVEHRIKTIFYVRTLNSIRRWFSDSCNNKIKPYLLLSTKTQYPRYFVWFKDFFWEICVFAIINSSLLSLGIVNAIYKLCLIHNVPCVGLSLIISLLFVIIIFLFFIHIITFYIRGSKQKI